MGVYKNKELGLGKIRRISRFRKSPERTRDVKHQANSTERTVQSGGISPPF